MTPKRPTLPEGTDPLEALRQLQRALANPRRMVFSGSAATEDVEYDRGATEAERAAGMNLAPIVGAVEALVATLRQQAQELDPFAVPAWYGSVWACPVAECEWTHREENAVSSTDAEAAERVRGSLVDHFLSEHGPHSLAHALVTRMLDWPAHCSEWIAGSDPENPDQCPEYASPGTDKCALHDPRQVEYAAELMTRQGWLSPSQAAELRTTAHRLTVEAFARPQLSRDQERNLIHGGSTDAKPRPRVAYPPPNTEWRHGFPPKGAATMWRCQRCGTNHEGNPPRCLHCGYTVLDPGHWIALPPEAGS